MEKIILLVLCEFKDSKQLICPQVHSYLKKRKKNSVCIVHKWLQYDFKVELGQLDLTPSFFLSQCQLFKSFQAPIVPAMFPERPSCYQRGRGHPSQQRRWFATCRWDQAARCRDVGSQRTAEPISEGFWHPFSFLCAVSLAPGSALFWNSPSQGGKLNWRKMWIVFQWLSELNCLTEEWEARGKTGDSSRPLC